MRHNLGKAALLLAVFAAMKAWLSAQTGLELIYPLDSILFLLSLSASILLGLIFLFSRKPLPIKALIGRVVMSACLLLLLGWCAVGCPSYFTLVSFFNGFRRWETNRSFNGPTRFPSPNNTLQVVMYEHPCGGVGDTGIMLVLEGLGPLSKVMLVRDEGGATSDCITAIKWLGKESVCVYWKHAQPMVLGVWGRPVYMRMN